MVSASTPQTTTNPHSHIPQNILTYVQTPEKTTSKDERERGWAEFKYETGPVHSIIRSELTAPAAKKQRFIDVTRSLLDISNESADAFPPLKSCLGCINALVKYYEVRPHRIARDPADVFILGMQRRRRQTRRPRPMAYQAEGNRDDNQRPRQSRGDREARTADQVSITSLPSCPLKPIARTRSLKDIEKRSRMLLEKGKGARILDKRQDSGMVVKLVEELRQAILIYQVGLDAVENHDQVELMQLR